MTRILLIDDEPQIQKFLRISLGSQQYDVISAENGRTGISKAVQSRPDLIILDLGLPDLDGKHVLQSIVRETRTPVMVLSVRDAESEKVACLNMGAFDYVVKPFSVNELLARVRRILEITGSLQKKNTMLFNDESLSVDEATRRVTLNNEPVSLTRKEWAVLLQLMHAPGRLVTQTALLEHIWGKTHIEDTQYLRNVIQKLRQKLQDNAASPRYIETEPGIGYRFIPLIDKGL
jgi:two-component system KDP operon response regulator KdpE